MKIWQYLIRYLSAAILKRQGYAPDPKVAIYFKDDAIGDFLMGTAVLRELAKRYDRVYLVCLPALRPIAELYLPAEQVLTVDITRFNRNLFERLRYLRGWLALGPELAIMSSCRSSFVDQVAAVFRGRVRQFSTDDPAPKKQRRRHLYTGLGGHPDDRQVSPRFLCGAHEKEHHLIEAAFAVTFTPEQTRPWIPVDRLPPPDNAPNGYFCFLPDTGDGRRTYPFVKLLGVAEAATANGSGIMLSARRIASPTHERLKNLTAQTSLLESLRFIAHAQFVLTNETGLGHAAWIMNRPTVMIMPGGNFGHFHAKVAALLAVYDERPCFNCHHHCQFEFTDQFPCIAEIPTERIVSRVEQAAGLLRPSV
jgi:ADP-heptose:LPS heptosyltransferase